MSNRWFLSRTWWRRGHERHPVVIDFWRRGAVRARSPVLDEIARGVGDQATIAKVNVDEGRRWRRAGRRRPQLVFFKDGVEKPAGGRGTARDRQAARHAPR
jgi:hypothetical protein